MSSIEVRIPRKQRKRPVSFAARDVIRKKVVSPGDVITESSDYMRFSIQLFLGFGWLFYTRYTAVKYRRSCVNPLCRLA